MNAARVQLDQLSVSYGGPEPAVRGVDLVVEPGELLCVLGASGSGKSSLLHAIGGYVPATGTLQVDGQDWSAWPPERRQIGMVFQSYALFPHLSVLDNVAFGLRMRGIPRRQRQERAAEALERVGLTPALHSRPPATLSGGQQQRVAVARALVLAPRLLLLDEPFANLDRRLREELRDELRRLQQQAQVTTLLVTHDQEEALALADRIAVMQDGALLQVDTPASVYRRPAAPAVAELTGEANWLPLAAGTSTSLALQPPPGVHEGMLQGVWNWEGPGSASGNAIPGAWLLVRPEDVRLLPSTASDGLAGEVLSVAFQGSTCRVGLKTSWGELRTRVDTALGGALRVGATVTWSLSDAVGWTLPPNSRPCQPSRAGEGASDA